MGVMRAVRSDYDQIESRGLGSTPGVVYLLSKRLRNRNTDNSEISAEKAGQNCLVHNDPPTGGSDWLRKTWGERINTAHSPRRGMNV